jgi:hypothetical protein
VVDHRTDVYSLGATLYELLTLNPVCDAVERTRLLRQIVEDDPLPARHHNPAVSLDLETIVLKALAKEPERRYQSARELADDLRRFLEHRPIQARRPTALERAATWGRRHRALVGAAIGLLVLAAVALAVSTALIAREQWKTREAYERLSREQERTRAAFEAEAQQRARAERNFQQARQIVDFVTELSEHELADKPELQGLRRKLLGAALDYYRLFIDQRRDDPALQVQLAASHLRVADILDEIGSRADALAALDRARELQESVLRDRPAVPEVQSVLYSIYRRAGMLRGGRDLQLLAQPKVQEELGLDPAQVKTVERIWEQRHDRFRGLPTLGPDDWQARFAELAAQQQVLGDLLTPDQARRLRQLAFQQLGIDAFNDAEVARTLALTEEQQEKIRALQDQARRSFWGHRTEDHPEQRRKTDEQRFKWEETWRATRQHVLNLLTDEQKSRWHELTGTPFQGSLWPWPRGTFGPRPGQGGRRPNPSTTSAPNVSP